MLDNILIVRSGKTREWRMKNEKSGKSYITNFVASNCPIHDLNDSKNKLENSTQCDGGEITML